MSRKNGIRSLVLLVLVLAGGGGLAAWKRSALQHDAAASASPFEPLEVVAGALAAEREYLDTTTSVGTVLALRSVTLRNELAGTVREVALVPGAVVEPGTRLVALDVAVESAELAAQEAQVALAESMLGRMQRALDSRGASESDVERARAERDVARAQVARTRALIERKTLRAPFRARVGLADVHVGQYLDEGTRLTTLQAVDEAAHVDFAVTQDVAAGLAMGERVAVTLSEDGPPLSAEIVALDARVDPATRNAWVRARLESGAPLPGSSVRVRVPVGSRRSVVVVPATALRKGPAGDHVFVLAEDPQGKLRAQERAVRSGPLLGDEVVVLAGLTVGERVAASGSFKLRDGVLVVLADAAPGAGPATQGSAQ